MGTQSIMVPPNNTPWPGITTSSSTTKSGPDSSTTTSSSTTTATAATSSTPSSHYPHPPYYHPSTHPHAPHQAPYYPYHPYSPSAYPPYPPPAHPHVHPAYHHSPYPPAHPPSTPAPAAAAPSSKSHSKSSSSLSKDPSASSSSSSSSATATAAPTGSHARTGAYKASKAEISKGSTSKSNSNESRDGTPAPTSGPKTFRFEGSISSETYRTTKSFDLAGVNILNRKPLDTRTALDKLQRRRETHNRVERKRRDCINQLVDDLTKLLPPKHLDEATSKCHRVNVLRGAVAHIKFLTESNNALTKTLETFKQNHPDMQNEIDVVSAAVASAAATAAATTTTTTTTGAVISPSDDNVKQTNTNNDSEMGMDVDSPLASIKDDDIDIDNDNEDQLKSAKSVDGRTATSIGTSASRSASPSLDHRPSMSESPRLTPSRAMARPPVIVASAPSPTTDRDSPRSAKASPVPPISIITTPAETHSNEAHAQHTRGGSISDATSPSSSYAHSHSPLFPPSPYTTPFPSEGHAFPPSPVSPSPLHQNPFSHAEGSNRDQGASKDSNQQQQQLSPFMHRPSSHSPSLPPISSLANLQIQSPPPPSGHPEINGSSSNSNERHPFERSLSPSSRASPPTSDSKSPNNPTLPRLVMPSEQHLHPSYGNKSEKPEYKNQHSSQAPVSPLSHSP
ncbi:hypothetical protein BGZ94_004092, partial [Podila epigama]